MARSFDPSSDGFRGHINFDLLTHWYPIPGSSASTSREAAAELSPRRKPGDQSRMEVLRAREAGGGSL